MELSQLERELKKTGSFNPNVFARENGANFDKEKCESTVRKALENQANLARIADEKSRKSIEQYVNKLEEFKEDVSVFKNHGVLSLVTAAHLWKVLHCRKPTKYFLLPTEAFALGAYVSGCGGTVTPEPPGPVEYMYYEVPYVSQPAGSELCGVASSIMVLNYYGEDLSMNTFGPTITTDGKIDFTKLYPYLDDKGYTHDFFKVSEGGGIDSIKEVLERGPFMVEQKFSLTNDSEHHRVIIGYDDDKEEFITHDPQRGENFKIKYDDFFDISIYKKCWCFEIRPKNKGEKDTKNYQEKAIQIVNSQIESILGKF